MFDLFLTGLKAGYSSFSECESGQKSMIFCGKFVPPEEANAGSPPAEFDGFVSGSVVFVLASRLPVLNVAMAV